MYLLKNNIIFRNVLVVILLWPILLYSQTNQVQFGKNRVQYHDDFDQWLYYETDLFTVNWYGKSKTAGHKVVRIAEREFNDIIKTIDFKTNEKTEFLVFADITDLKQSNIGISDAFIYDDDITKTIDNKIFIAFDGNHKHLRKQIREGIAAVYLNNILFGSNLQEIVQNSIMLNLPQWYKDGLISYFGEEWSSTYDVKVAKALSKKRNSSFERLAKEDPRLAGHMFWNYVGFNYGKNAIGNLVYVTRINRNLDKGFQYVLGTTYENVIQNVFNYYKNQSETKLSKSAEKPIPLKSFTKLKQKENVTAMSYSPDDKSLLVVTNQMSKIKVKLVDVASGKYKTLYKYGAKNKIQAPDPNYPVVAWNPDGKKILISYEKRDYIYLKEYNLQTGKSITQLIPERYQRIYSIAYWNDKNIIINGTMDGYDNLFMYRLSTRQTTEITNAPFDLLDMVVAGQGDQKKIYFSSNRPDNSMIPIQGDTILPIGSFDIFSLAQVTKQDGTMAWEMEQITFTKLISETKPTVDKYGRISFLTNEFRNNAIIRLSPGITYRSEAENDFSILGSDLIISNYALSTSNQNVIINGFDGEFNKLVKIDSTNLTNNTSGLLKGPKEFGYDIKLSASKIDSTAKVNAGNTIFNKVKEEIPENMKFRTKYGELKAPEIIEKKISVTSSQPMQEGSNKMMPLNPLNIVPYRLRFKIHESSANFDNSQLFEGLNTYVGEGDGGLFPPFGLLLKAHMRDMFEDYRLEGGIRIPISLNGNETYVLFDDLKSRIDKRISIYRKVSNERLDSNTPTQPIRKNIVLMGQYDLKYPIDQFNAVKVGLTLRQDKLFYKATDNITLNIPTEAIERVGIRATYILDNTLDKGLNLFAGTRAKVFVEWVKKFDLNFDKGVALNFNKGHMWVAGFDARNYFELDRHSIFATRLASQVSFGSEKILYYLGGSDGWLFPSFNEETQTATDENYAYQIATPSLRGFQYNIRNGNNFALLNGELRVPFVRYLSRRTLSSSFLNNLQLVGFFDIGSAWNGWDPFTKYNPLNTVFISQPGIDIKVNYFRNPIVFGYGGGLRFLLFGYFMRLDYAKGWDTGTFTKPRLYFSLGTDF